MAFPRQDAILEEDINDVLGSIFDNFSPDAFFIVRSGSNSKSTLEQIHRAVTTKLNMSSNILFLIMGDEVEIVPLDGEFEVDQTFGSIRLSKIKNWETKQSIIIKVGNKNIPATSSDVQRVSCVVKEVLSQTEINAIIVPGQLLQRDGGLYAVDPSYPSSTNLFENDKFHGW